MPTVLFVVLSGIFGVSSSSGVAQTGAASGQYSGDEISAVEADIEVRREEVQQAVDRVSEVGLDLRDSQALVDAASRRSSELQGDSGELRGQLAELRESRNEARREHRERAVAAYRGEDPGGLALLLEGIVGGGVELSSPELRQILFEGRDDLEEYEVAQQELRDTIRQIEQKDRDYAEASEEESRQTENLDWKQEELRAEISELRAEISASETYVEELEAEERERIATSAPATGGIPGQRGYEAGVARQDIVAEEVEPITQKRYLKLYRESARKYGFADDWYILAAVGKVESDHGSNMGPSSAGAMGPMQFLPSTWVNSGVDGNGDGEANIMDPEDAIPAAAKYLQTGGAPDDWYAALYSYNHADWYVQKVLAVSEGYREIDREGGSIN